MQETEGLTLLKHFSIIQKAKDKTMSKTETKKKFQFKGERTKSTIIIIVALIIFLALIIMDFVPGYTLFLAAISAMGTSELIKAVGSKSKMLLSVACAVSFFTVCAVGFSIAIPHPTVILSFYMLILLFLSVVFNKEIKYLDSVMAFFSSVCVPYAFSCFIRLNNFSDINPSFTRWEECFLVGLGFACSWITDSFAFLVGRKIGKHKMCPVISPKKSVEGAVGGTVVTSVFNVGLVFIFGFIASKYGHMNFISEGAIKYLIIIPVSWVLSVVSMFGDLAASVLKRNVGIKDYSNLLPGHGGIMDRFDSIVFVVPVLYGICVFIFG